MTKKEEFEYNSIQDNLSIGKYLNAMIEGFEKNKVSFKSDNNEIILSPNDLIEFSIKAKRKGNKNKISLKFFWKDVNERSQPDDDFEIFA
ncbi:Amphi-Trp domain-containing protein [Desulfonema limicola]|uniref:Amphi-Trp domain-containing protein n=1 Tax=Desulfonema limicola TaxID=45656 RepID=A0A975GK87_9BACT|nr:amphi-Trp domain-containing protein [Desulfonema limicola]QTA83563.1 Amphi-Trp domain-containing protein [Desulfonema limicola]